MQVWMTLPMSCEIGDQMTKNGEISQNWTSNLHLLSSSISSLFCFRIELISDGFGLVSHCPSLENFQICSSLAPQIWSTKTETSIDWIFNCFILSIVFIALDRIVVLCCYDRSRFAMSATFSISQWNRRKEERKRISRRKLLFEYRID